jgi:hypothetical protein
MKDGMSEKSNVQFGSFIFDLEMHQCRKYRTKKYVTLKIHKEKQYTWVKHSLSRWRCQEME